VLHPDSGKSGTGRNPWCHASVIRTLPDGNVEPKLQGVSRLSRNSRSGFMYRNRVLSTVAAAILSLALVGCTSDGTPEWPEVQPDGTLVLVSGGYGYEAADVVLIDTQRTPEPGDIVQYDDSLNESDCYSFGPGQYLARVVAKPGATVQFHECLFVAGCFLGAIECGPEISPRTENVCWGEEWYENVVGMSLVVPAGEYLSNRWLGQECRQGDGEVRAGSRFTMKSEAIIGVLVKRVGHDDRMQQFLEGIVY
jgi:hypothetical protein